jgi:hypothetical protein
MNNENQNDPNTNKGLIDRRFFLKASSATVAAVAAGSLIATSVADDQISVAKNEGGVPDGSSETGKQWKAGWMAF